MTKLAEQPKQGADQAWESLAEGWRELSARASGALASDVFDDDDKVVVRIEAPGLRREDFNIELRGDTLTVWGEKRFDREVSRGRYSVVQCAYGSFRRDVALPVAVKADHPRATYRDGVLRIELPRTDEARARRIVVKTA